MSYSLIANVAGSGAQGFTTGNIDTSGASLIVVSLGFYSPGTPTLADNKSNTWVPLTKIGPGGVAQRFFYAENPTVGAGHNFTVSGSDIYASGFVSAFGGAALASVFDAESAGGSGSGSTIQPGSVTPAANDSLAVVGIGDEDDLTMSINGGFTITDQIAIAFGSYYGGALAYLIQTTAAAVNPTWTLSSSVSAATRSAVFKVATAAGGGLRRNASLNGLGASGPFFHDPLAHYRRAERRRRDEFMRTVRKAA